jgi:DNA-binding NtrC family response regulator
MAKAARKLGITERMIAYKIKKYGIKREMPDSCAVQMLYEQKL